jgi:hypothetical protein
LCCRLKYTELPVPGAPQCRNGGQRRAVAPVGIRTIVSAVKAGFPVNPAGAAVCDSMKSAAAANVTPVSPPPVGMDRTMPPL